MAEIKNLKKVAQRILKAIRNKERIILYGDADLDGISSIIILKEAISNLGGKVEKVYFPDREKEGYGINKMALKFLEKTAPALFISLDCGISNFEEVNKANSMGFEIIIIDHHQVLDKLPKAEIIVDPKQKGDKYPFKELSTAGITYKLSQVLLQDQLCESLKNNFLELVALATIADMMVEEKDNRIMIEHGLFSLENTFRPGLKAFFEKDTIKDNNILSTRQIAQKIISALNIVEVKDHLNETYLLLTSNSLEEAKIKVEELFKKREQKQLIVKEILEEIENRVFKKTSDPIVFEGDVSWPLILLGGVASRICNQHKKPAFIFRIGDKVSRGAVRTPQEVNGVDLMNTCSKLLETFGGHPRASGFTIKTKNIEKFKECLVKKLCAK